MNYRLAAFKGFSWQTILKVVSNCLVLAKITFLARFLNPDDFGVFSLVMIALGLTESATQTGVNVVIVQSKRTIEYFVDTAWVIAILRGLLISILMVLLGFVMSYYFKLPQLLFLITLASLIPAIKGFINPAIVGMQKDLSFFSDTLYRFSLVSVETVLTIVGVLFFPSVSTWILALVGAAFFEVTISFLFFQVRPHFMYRPDRASEIFSQIKKLSLSSLIGYLNENADNLLLGKLFGTYSLGLYQNTYGLSHEANYEISKSIHHGVFPIFAKLQGEPERLRKAFFKTALWGLGLMVLASIPLLVFPRWIILFLFQEQWLPAVPLVRWLTIAGIIQGMGMICYSLLLATKKVGLMNIHLALNFVTMIICMLALGSIYGLQGAMIGLAFARLLSLTYLASQMYQILKKHA